MDDCPDKIEVMCPVCLLAMSIFWHDRDQAHECPACETKFDPNVVDFREQENWMKLFRRLRGLQAEGATFISAQEEREILTYMRDAEPVSCPTPELRVTICLDHAAGALELKRELAEQEREGDLSHMQEGAGGEDSL